MHVLIIEDEPLIALSIEDALRGCDRDCTSFDFASSIDQAIAAARLRCPDLITADVQLSPGCGISAVQAICGGAPTPVIFITGTAGEIEVRRPGSVIVHKPFADADIRRALERVLTAPGSPDGPVPSHLPIRMHYAA